MAAYVRTIAGKRGRNAQLAEQAVLQSKAFTEEEAAKATPPLVDLVATSLDDLLKKLDGRTVTRFDGRSVTLRTASATDRADRDDAAAAHPQRDCASEHRVHPAEPRHARIDDRVVEPGCGASRRRRRALAAARVLRAPGAAHQLRRAAADALRAGALRARNQSDELWAAHHWRHHQPDLRIADADRFSGARASVEPERSSCRWCSGSPRSRRFSCGSR